MYDVFFQILAWNGDFDESDTEFVCLGDLYINDTMGVIVNNDYDGIVRLFDEVEEAMEYIYTRICSKPYFYDPKVGMTARILVDGKRYGEKLIGA